MPGPRSVSRRWGLGLLLALAMLAVPAAAQGAPLGLTNCGPREGVHQCSGLVTTWDGVPLDATVTLPSASAGRLPLVVNIHGFGNSKHEYLDPAETAYTDNAYGWAKAGYAVLTYTARGLWDSCGTPESRLANPVACARGYIHLADVRYEVRDTQELIGRLVDDGTADAARLGVTGDSYGGGQSFMLAALRDRVMLPDGRLTQWRSPRGVALRIAAAAPVIPWTDLIYAIAPNGRTFANTVAPASVTSNPVGIFKTSVANGIFAAAQFAVGPGQPVGEPFVQGRPMGYLAPPGTDPDADVAGWVARADRGEPYDDEEVKGIIEKLTRFHSAFHIDSSVPPPPLFVGSGFTDDLFPANEALRFANRTRRDHPRVPVSLLFGDYGHQRASNKVAVRAQLIREIHAWFDHYLRGRGRAPAKGVSASTQTCPRTAVAEGPFRAASFPALARGSVRYSSTAAQSLSSAGGDPSVGASIDPVAGGGDGCATTPSATAPGTATYRLPAAPKGGYMLLGAPAVSARLRVSGSNAQVAARLWDVAPNDGPQTLVARALYRPSGDGAAAFELHANGWRFAEGHVPKLELVGSDAPFARPSNGSFDVTVERLDLRLPVRDPVARTRPLKPRLTLATKCTRFGLRATATLRYARARRVEFFVGVRRRVTDARAPFERIFSVRTARRGGRRIVSARAVLTNGRTMRAARGVRACVRRLRAR